MTLGPGQTHCTQNDALGNQEEATNSYLASPSGRGSGLFNEERTSVMHIFQFAVWWIWLLLPQCEKGRANFLETCFNLTLLWESSFGGGGSDSICSFLVSLPTPSVFFCLYYQTTPIVGCGRRAPNRIVMQMFRSVLGTPWNLSSSLERSISLEAIDTLGGGLSDIALHRGPNGVQMSRSLLSKI